MTLLDRLAQFSIADYSAFLLLMVTWSGCSWFIENPPKSRVSVGNLMAAYRKAWMVELTKRQNRIFDSQIVSNLRQGTAFFASGSMLAIGGGFALLGNADQIQGLAEDFTETNAPVFVWEVKVMVMVALAINAFLKFVWSHRLFGYCAVLMAAVPQKPGDAAAMGIAKKAGEINVTAAKSYNRGLRSVYFGIASAAWLVGPYALLATTVFTLLVILRREFASDSRKVLMAIDATSTAPHQHDGKAAYLSDLDEDLS